MTNTRFSCLTTTCSVVFSRGWESESYTDKHCYHCNFVITSSLATWYIMAAFEHTLYHPYNVYRNLHNIGAFILASAHLKQCYNDAGMNTPLNVGNLISSFGLCTVRNLRGEPRCIKNGLKLATKYVTMLYLCFHNLFSWYAPFGRPLVL